MTIRLTFSLIIKIFYKTFQHFLWSFNNWTVFLCDDQENCDSQSLQLYTASPFNTRLRELTSTQEVQGVVQALKDEQRTLSCRNSFGRPMAEEFTW